MPAPEENPLTPPPARNPDIRTLGIIAGAGEFPRQLAAACRDRGIEPFIVAFRGQTDPQTVEGHRHIWTRPGAAGRTMAALKKNGALDLVMIGAMRRPSLAGLRPDFKALSFFAGLGMKALGDDGFLKALRRFLEKEGFRLHGIHEFMPGLLTPEGILGRAAPGPGDWRDITRGVEILRATGPLDIGQAVIVESGIVLGVEAAEGTDELIRRCAPLRRQKRGGVLVKLCKPGQDRDLDLPATGPRTVKNLLEHGFSGLAVHAGHSLVLDIENTIALADAGKIFVTGVTPEKTPENINEKIKGE